MSFMSKTSRLEVGRPWNSGPYHEATPVSTPCRGPLGSREQPAAQTASPAATPIRSFERRDRRPAAAGASSRSVKEARQSLLEIREGLPGRRHDAEEAEVLGADRALFDHRIELDQVPPIVPAVKDEGQLLLRDLARLEQGDDLEELVERPVAAGEGDDGLGLVGQPELAD